MSLTLDDNSAVYQIRGYKPGQIQVNQQIFTNSIIVSPRELIEKWEPKQLSEMTHEHLLDAIKLKPTVLLIGTGEKLIFPPIELYGEFLNQGIGVEVMNTSAACHTYNILTAENRQVVAALFL